MTGKTIIVGLEALVIGAIAWLMDLPDAFRLLIVLQIADVAMGCIAARQRNELRSALAWRGWSKKLAAWVIVLVVYEFQVDAVGVIGADAPMPDITLAAIAAIGFAVAEALSIIENAQRAGLPIPRFLTNGLAQTREMIFGGEDDGPAG